MKKPRPPNPILNHARGDEHSASGFRYECALRCLWLLDLEGTANVLSVGEEEDCRITGPDRSSVWRQVKKRDGRPWALGVEEFHAFLERTYARFCDDPETRSEFYTNNAISDELVERTREGTFLDPGAPKIRELAPRNTAAYAQTVLFREQHRQADAGLMAREVRASVRALVEKICPSPACRDLVTETEIRDIAGRLLAAEYSLCKTRSSVTWSQVQEEIRLTEVVSEVTRRYEIQSAFVSWARVIENPATYLAPAAAHAVEIVRRGEVISRAVIEDVLWKRIDDWLTVVRTGNSGSAPIIVLAGAHGSGKTVGLAQVGHRLVKQNADLAVYWAPPSPPDDPRRLTFPPSQATGTVVLLDDLFDGWDGFLKLQRVYFPPRVLFIGSASCDPDGPECAALLRMTGERALVIRVDSIPTDQELEQLILVLDREPFAASVREKRRSGVTNLRHAVALLRGELPSDPLHVSEVKQLTAEQRTSICPVLMTSALGVILPRDVLDRHLGSALPPGLWQWVVEVDTVDGSGLIFEDSREASALLEAFWGGARPDKEFETVRSLLKSLDLDRSGHRKFARELLSRLATRKPEVLRRLAEKSRGEILECVRREPLWAIAFCWLPVLAQAGLLEVLTEIIGRTPVPSSVPEFVLFLELYGARDAVRHLDAALRGLPEWEPWTVVRAAEMIRKLPRTERRQLGRLFARLFMDLPTIVIWDCLRFRDALGLLIDMVASFGGWWDRERAMRELEALFRVQAASNIEMRQNWMEPYLDLAQRRFGQRRSGLSLALTQELLAGTVNSDLGLRLKEVYEQEQALPVERVVRLAFTYFEPEAQDRFVRPLPLVGNLLSMVSAWAPGAERVELLERYLEVVRRVAKTEVPFERISALVLPGFRVLRGSAATVGQRFASAVMAWAPSEALAATEETSKWLLGVLFFVSQVSWAQTSLRADARRALVGLVVDGEHAKGPVMSFLVGLSKDLGIAPPHREASTPLVEHWTMRSGLAQQFLAGITQLEWSDEEAVVLASQALRHWQRDAAHALSLSYALLRLGDLDHAAETANDIAERPELQADGCALLAMVAAQRKDPDSAYRNLSRAMDLLEEGAPGTRLWLARALHRELANIAIGQARGVHLVCAELLAGRRLRPYPELVRMLGHPARLGDSQ